MLGRARSRSGDKAALRRVVSFNNVVHAGAGISSFEAALAAVDGIGSHGPKGGLMTDSEVGSWVAATAEQLSLGEVRAAAETAAAPRSGGAHRSAQALVRREGKLVIAMVGLPARGKTYISRHLKRHLTWMGIRTEIFNVGNVR